MASTRFIGINISDWPEGADIRFISEMSRTIYTGDGTIPSFSQKQNLDDSTPLRLLVGIQKKDLSVQQKKFTEAFFAYHHNIIKDNMPSIWTGKPNWRPLNPARIPAPIKESRLDYDFLVSLGLRPATWEQHVFLQELTRAKRGQSSEQETVRLYLALSMFGLQLPEQFFTAK